MKKVLRTIRDYLLYCGIEKDAYNAVKKDAYISNYKVWRVLQVFMVVVFALFLVSSFFSELVRTNRLFYSYMFLYSAISTCFLFMLKKDAILAQFLIYLSIAVLFLFACYISQNKPNLTATTFIVFLLITHDRQAVFHGDRAVRRLHCIYDLDASRQAVRDLAV